MKSRRRPLSRDDTECEVSDSYSDSDSDFAVYDRRFLHGVYLVQGGKKSFVTFRKGFQIEVLAQHSSSIVLVRDIIL